MRVPALMVVATGLASGFGCFADENLYRPPNDTGADADVEDTEPTDTRPDAITPLDTAPDTAPPADTRPPAADSTNTDDTAVGADSGPGTDASDDVAEVDTAAPACGDGVCNVGEDCLTCADCPCPERCGTDLFLSEYLEGASWNKALEVANFTGRDIDLQGYALWKITNGGDWSEGSSHPFKLTGVLEHGAALVVCHSTAAAGILAACDISSSVDFAEFNGDDAVALVRNGAIIDVIGEDGADPGDGWSVGGVSEATIDHTLRRKPEVVEGTDLWSTNQSTWEVLDADIATDLGAFTVAASCIAPFVPDAALNEVAASGAGFIEIAGFVGVGQTGTLDVGGWVIATTSGRYTFPAGSTVPAGGFRALMSDQLGFELGLVDRAWLYDEEGQLQDVLGWNAGDLAVGASHGRIPDGTGEFVGNSIATPGAANRNPDRWCGDDVCQEDEDCRGCAEDCPACYPGPGDLVISEVMAEPTSGPEWFEITNPHDVPFELAEMIVRDDGLDFHAVAPAATLVVEPGAILVMTSGTLAGVLDQYRYDGLSLANGDELVLERRGVMIDRVEWSTTPGPGVAWSLSGGAIDAAQNDLAVSWCAAVDGFGAGQPGQLGTPGAPNPSCSVCGDGACGDDESCDTCADDCGECPREDCALDLFISEYVEGTSYNKAIEIANFTGAPVDLSQYALWRITNGGSTWAGLTAASKVGLTGTLLHGEVWVGCNTSGAESLKAHCDALYGQGSAPTNFNGDDAVGLARDGVLIDAIGFEAVDPGTGWVVAGVDEGTVDHTLVRVPAVKHGTLDWSTGSADEWQVLGEDDFDGLGTHEVDYACEP